MDGKRARETLDELRKAGLPESQLRLLHEKHVGSAGVQPVDSPFKRHALKPNIINLPFGHTFSARFLGPPFPAQIHWLETKRLGKDSKESFPCFGQGVCRYCPGYKSLYGYWPILTFRRLPERDDAELLPSVLALWEQLTAELVEMGVERGTLVHFFRDNRRPKTPQIEIVESGCDYQLPTFDVCQVLLGRWGLSSWPDQGLGTHPKVPGKRKAEGA